MREIFEQVTTANRKFRYTAYCDNGQWFVEELTIATGNKFTRCTKDWAESLSLSTNSSKNGQGWPENRILA